MVNGEMVEREDGQKEQDRVHCELFCDNSHVDARPWNFRLHILGKVSNHVPCSTASQGVALRRLNQSIIGKHSIGWTCPRPRMMAF